MRAHRTLRLAWRPKLAVLACAAALLLGTLQGCASNQAAAFSAVRMMLPGGMPGVDANHPLDPRYRYLRVTVNGVALLMVLGYVDDTASGSPVQVWYSAHGEVMRLRDGRLAGLVGTPVEWREVRWPDGLPAWTEVGRTALPVYPRVLDEMPGYHLGQSVKLRLEPTSPPDDSAWVGAVPPDLQWYRERPVQGRAHAALYAVRHLVRQGSTTAEPVYGEQCLSAEFCLSWQSWPPYPQEPRS